MKKLILTLMALTININSHIYANTDITITIPTEHEAIVQEWVLAEGNCGQLGAVACLTRNIRQFIKEGVYDYEAKKRAEQAINTVEKMSL